eukprot:11004054-Ditylum_brightwellii.AAC.1
MQYLSPHLSKVTRQDDDEVLFVVGCKNMGIIIANLVKELHTDKEQTFGIYEKAEEGVLHVRPGAFGLTRLDKIGFFMSNGCSYVHEYSGPGIGYLVIVGSEEYTRMHFPESKSEATLTAK